MLAALIARQLLPKRLVVETVGTLALPARPICSARSFECALHTLVGPKEDALCCSFKLIG